MKTQPFYHRELKENERVIHVPHVPFTNDNYANLWASLLFTRREDGDWQAVTSDEFMQDIQARQAGQELK